jgi:hypothetical protein
MTEFFQLLFNKMRITVNGWLFVEEKNSMCRSLIPSASAEDSDNPIFIRRWKKLLTLVTK